MKKIQIIIFLLLAWNVNAQISGSYFQSKHLTDIQHHNPIDYILDRQITDTTIIPLQENNGIPTSTVMGYLPYWEYPEAMEYLQFDILSHIAVFDFELNSDGTLDNPPNWPWIDLINTSHENGVRVILSATNFNSSQIHNLLTNDAIKSTFFNEVHIILQQYQLDGINIDFENLASADRGEILNNFMYDLTQYLHNVNSDYEISFAAPPINWGGWDFYGLANSCDYLFIMGYNFYGSWSNTSGACAPLIGGNYNITKVITDEYWDVVQCCPDKLILGVPYYGNKWTTQSNSAYSTVIDHINQPTYKNAINKLEQDTIIWDATSNTSWGWYKYSDYYQIWFDNDSSLGLKYDLSAEYSLAGTGIWALGYDGNRMELWDELWKHYGKPVDVAYTDNQKEICIYPNPCSNELNIIIYENYISSIEIRIYHFDGRIAHFEEIYLQNNHINYDVSFLASGIYYVNISDKHQSKIKSIKLIVQ